MVDLPTVSRALATTEAPNSPLSAAAVAAPYASLGQALDKLGGALDDVSVDMAKEAGKRAVTMDDEGNLQVQQMPPLGKAAEAFNRTSQMTYLTQLDPAIKAKVLEKRIEFDGKPQAFQEWADNYGGELVSGQPTDELARSVGLLVDQHASAAYQGLALGRHAQDVQNNRAALKDFLDDKDNVAAQLAQAGGTDSFEYKQIIHDYVSRQQQAMTDPSLNYTKERADADLRDLTSRHGALAVVGAVRRVAEDKSYSEDGTPNGGPIKAKELAESLLTDERFGHLSPEQRLQFNKLALGQIKALTVEGQVAIAALNQEAAALDDLLKKGAVAPATIEDFKTRAAEAGATKALARIIQADALSKTYPWFAGLPSEDRASFINGQTGRPDARSLLDKFENAESRGNVHAQSATSSALGSLQFTKGTWLTLIRQSRPDLAAGKTDTELLALRADRDLSREMATVNNQQNSAIFAGQGIFPSAGRLYLAHLLGPRDAVAVIAADPNTPMKGLIWDKAYIANPDLMQRYPTAGAIQEWANRKMGQVPSTPAAVANLKPTEQAKFLVFAQENAAKDLTSHLGVVKKTIDSGFAPNPRDLDELGALVHAVGTDQQKQQVIELGALAQFGAQYTIASPQDRAALRTEIANQYRIQGSQVLGHFLTYADQIDKQVTQAYQTAPYDASVRYGGRPALAPANPDRPAGLAEALHERVQRQAIFRTEQSLPPTSVLDPAEANAWKTALAHGDVRLGSAFLQEVAKLPKDIASATFNSRPIADGITGMINSRNPDRMEVGFTALDMIWRRNPQIAESTFGKEAIDQMQIWQGKRDAFEPSEIANDFLTVDDPSQKAARERLKTEAEKELANTTAESLVSNFTGGLFSRVPFTSGPHLADGTVPATAMFPERMLADYRTIYTALRENGLSPDKATWSATERLKQSWGPSEVAGNIIMKRPPEMVVNPRNGQPFYPSLGKSHQWIKDNINSKIEAMLGPQFGVPGRGEKSEPQVVGDSIVDPGPGRENWKFVGLVSDAKTEEDIMAGRPPSYSIVVQKRNGVLETVIDPKTGSPRHSFDISPYIAKYETDMRARERRVKDNLAASRSFDGVQP